jgi:hypothetical protein
MKIIKTVYLSPTNTRGSRIKATLHDDRRDETPTITIGYPHELSGVEVYAAAVRALFLKHHINTWATKNHDRKMYPVSTKRGYDFFITGNNDASISIDRLMNLSPEIVVNRGDL